ncbi:hypothetical protein KC19_1G146000 [Ceratodon purpureus]|uniref:Uncharacterized protein n=1 Tax=Ceratodon purpureus TaxID=3225 RepID=A0A8T0J881_CERPU|nr:hypothetical protein KC19_1G146000 [Ceratodon purpureus]
MLLHLLLLLHPVSLILILNPPTTDQSSNKSSNQSSNQSSTKPFLQTTSKQPPKRNSNPPINQPHSHGSSSPFAMIPSAIST